MKLGTLIVGIVALFHAMWPISSHAQTSESHTPSEPSAASMPTPAIDGSRPAQLIAFDGIRQLSRTALRVGMLAQELEYTLEVGPDGTATDCSLSRKFRSPLVTKQLCEVLMRDSRLSPALDATGKPTSGTYSGLIDFRMWIKPSR